MSASDSYENLANRPYVSFGGFDEEDRPRGNGNTTTGGATREVPRTTSTVGRYDDGAWSGSSGSPMTNGPECVPSINDVISLRLTTIGGVFSIRTRPKLKLFAILENQVVGVHHQTSRAGCESGQTLRAVSRCTTSRIGMI